MSSPIGGISSSASSLSLQKINSLQTKMDNVDLGSDISQAASGLIDAIKTGINTQFSDASLRSINTLFADFQSLLETEHPDILMDILSAMRHSGFQSADDASTDTRPEDTAAAAGAHLAHIIGMHRAISNLTDTDTDETNDTISALTNDPSSEAQAGILSAFLTRRITPPEDIEDASLRATFAEPGNAKRLASAEAGSLSAMLTVGEIATQHKTDKKANRSIAAVAAAKSQEAIDEAINKIQKYLSDGIDGIAELSQIAEALSEIPNVAISCPNILDQIHDAVIEYLQTQIGQLSESDARQLLTQVNEIIGSATGGTQLFSDEEINNIVDAMNPANIGDIVSFNEDPEMEQSPPPLPDDISVTDYTPTVIPTAASNAAGSLLVKPLDINMLMTSSQAITHTPLVSASAGASGDTSSDRNEALRKVSHVVDFLEKLCENGIDQVLHRLTKQLDQTGLTSLLRGDGAK